MYGVAATAAAPAAPPERGSGVFKAGSTYTEIRDVWRSNLAEEMSIIRDIVDEYPFVAMVRRAV